MGLVNAAVIPTKEDLPPAGLVTKATTPVENTKPLHLPVTSQPTVAQPMDETIPDTPPRDLALIPPGLPGSIAGEGVTPTSEPEEPTYTTESGIEMPEPYTVSEPLKDQEATVTGGPIQTAAAQTYAGQTMQQTLDESKQGLMDMLESDDPYMAQARARGLRAAEARGLGSSSYAGRASEGSAIDAAMPLVNTATQIASQERMTAQSLTAQSSVAAADRSARALMQEQQLAVQSGDNAKARELEAQIQRERNELNNYMQARDLAVRSGDAAEARRLDWERNERNIDVQIAENDLERKFRELQQDKDIDYKKWLEEATFGHEQVLRSNQQAMDAYSDFTQAASNILNNPETSSAQKNASMDALREGLTGTLKLLEGLSGINMEQYLPASINYETSGPDYDAFMNNQPSDISSREYADWYAEWQRRYGTGSTDYGGASSTTDTGGTSGSSSDEGDMGGYDPLGSLGSG